MGATYARRALPPELEPLYELALDLRWTWSSDADRVWRMLDPVRWAASPNPWTLLRDVPAERLERLAADPAARAELDRVLEARRRYLARPAWAAASVAEDGPRAIAYFSMEFGLGEALPLYAGGLGVLAGDYLKAASDVGLPVVGVGLLYQEGYFHQEIDEAGWQRELFPYNDPGELPLVPVLAADGRRQRVTLEFPGRLLHVRAWQAQVGRVPLYLLDTNDALNAPLDRAITAKLYSGDPTVQFLQEAVLGIAGWRLLEVLGVPVDVCHLNEGHAAMVVLERARCTMERLGLSFEEALWATRAGNVFTTHTAVPAAFDRFDRAFVEGMLPYLRIYVDHLHTTLPELLALGRAQPDDAVEPFNLAYLAMRGCIAANGVSALHGDVSRGLLRGLYPRWPRAAVPVRHVTNGVHVPTWVAPAADRLWEEMAGEERWRGEATHLPEGVAALSDERLWAARGECRRQLVESCRRRLARQLGFRGADADAIARARRALDPDALTIGFARRFAAYKRPTLLLGGRERLQRLLSDTERPVQLVVAGKAHPADVEGKALLQRWVELTRDPALRDRVVFLEDYDMALAQELVRGVDVWLNTPRRPWEACGTSGMKVLANGALNLSSLDGWWAEAYAPGLGWAIDAPELPPGPERDAAEAEQLYALLEREVVPAFYERDAHGLPVRWLAWMRASIVALAPRFSANRMVREYAARMYRPAARMLEARTRDDACMARALARWSAALARGWDTLDFGSLDVRREGDGLAFTVDVSFGRVDPRAVRVELFAEAPSSEEPDVVVPMAPSGPGSAEGFAAYHAWVATARPASDFTPRIVPHHPAARVPTEAWWIRWLR